MKNHLCRSLFSLFLAFSLLTGQAFAAAAYRRVTPAQAKSMMDSRPNAIILDVRTEEEYQAGHIPNAVLIPDYELESVFPSRYPDKNALILVYCQNGIRSAGATRALLNLGYQNAVDFGALKDWPYDVVTG